MDRDAAVAFCREKCLKETTVRHLISVEGVMRALAGRFDEDPDLWGLTGLFHDLDQDHTGDEGLGHAELAASWLREEGVDERIVNGVLAHAYERYRTDLMSRAVVHADAVSGLLVASALVRPEKADGMKVSSVKKKLKEKAFAPGVNREEILDVESSIGLPLDDFIAVSIGGLQSVAAEIGLVADARRSGGIVNIRPATQDDVEFLQKMLYEAARWNPDWPREPMEEVLAEPMLTRFHEGWGRPGDAGVIAELDGVPVGAAWYRLFTAEEPGYGFVDEKIPELGLAVEPLHRRKGIGGTLLRALMVQAREEGFQSLSLSVAVHNRSRMMYQRVGFERVTEDETGSWTMVVNL